MSERVVQSEVRHGLGSLPKTRVFRNQVGMGWVGSLPGNLKAAVMKYLRPTKMGLFVGSSDLIGWTSYVIRPEDVGKTVAVFTSVEVKDGNNGASPEQVTWIQNVTGAGGIAFVTRSKEHAVQKITNWKL